jgi:hypothetical protein
MDQHLSNCPVPKKTCKEALQEDIISPFGASFPELPCIVLQDRGQEGSFSLHTEGNANSC